MAAVTVQTWFSLLDCLHMVPYKLRLNARVLCGQCGDMVTVVLVKPTNGAYRAICDTCEWTRGTGTAKRLAELYASKHEHETRVEWVT